MILLIDNYDSFTYNLDHLLRQQGEDVTVIRSDVVKVEWILERGPRRIVVSPGPGRPGRRGVTVQAIRAFAGRIPILGVCLGHQALAVAFGGTVKTAPEIVHGRASPVHHTGRGCFAGLASPIPAMRYHSLVVERTTLPEELEVTAWLDDAERTIMGLRHRTGAIEGVQFHPESFMTPDGPAIVRRFLEGA